MNKNTKHWASITAGILSLAGYAAAANLGSEKYTYDASGNIIEKSIDGKVTKMSYDRANRVTTKQVNGKGLKTIIYDASGRPLIEKSANNQQTRSMDYGYGDKVLETKNDGGNTGFYYNAEGQLVGKKAGSGVDTYTWDGNVLASDGTDTFTNEGHVSGGTPVLTSEKNVVISDYLGNTLVMGELQFTSTAYGEGLELGRFTGKYYVKELEAFIFQHRLYSSAAGRWATNDPLGFPDGFNSYAYVNGKPLTYYDVYGTTEEEFFIRTYAFVGPGEPPTSTPFVEARFKVTYDKNSSPNKDKDTCSEADPNWSGVKVNIKNPPPPVKVDVEGDSTRAYWTFTAEITGTYDAGSPPKAYTSTKEFFTKSFEK